MLMAEQRYQMKGKKAYNMCSYTQQQPLRSFEVKLFWEWVLYICYLKLEIVQMEVLQIKVFNNRKVDLSVASI